MLNDMTTTTKINELNINNSIPEKCANIRRAKDKHGYEGVAQADITTYTRGSYPGRIHTVNSIIPSRNKATGDVWAKYFSKKFIVDGVVYLYTVDVKRYINDRVNLYYAKAHSAGKYARGANSLRWFAKEAKTIECEFDIVVPVKPGTHTVRKHRELVPTMLENPIARKLYVANNALHCAQRRVDKLTIEQLYHSQDVEAGTGITNPKHTANYIEATTVQA